MEFYDVIRTRRSIRSYRADPVPEESLNRVLEAARMAPSGSNRQPWRFYVIKDPEKRRRVAQACGGQMWIGQAPTVIVATGWGGSFQQGRLHGGHVVHHGCRHRFHAPDTRGAG